MKKINLKQYLSTQASTIKFDNTCPIQSETLRYVCKKSNDCEKCMFNNINSVKK